MCIPGQLPVLVNDGIEREAISPAGGEVVHVDIGIPAGNTSQFNLQLRVCVCVCVCVHNDYDRY